MKMSLPFRRSGARNAVVAVLVHGAACSLIACDEPKPCAGVVEGATYEIEVHGSASDESPPGCSPAWGVSDGSVITAFASKTVESATCKVGVPELNGLVDWSFEVQPTEAPSDGFLRGNYDAHFKECEVRVRLRLGADSNLPCFEEKTGKNAECGLNLLLEPRGGLGCPKVASCAFSLASTVTRQ